MSYNVIEAPIELTDDQLDMVAAGKKKEYSSQIGLVNDDTNFGVQIGAGDDVKIKIKIKY
jgi:hypothetical protein